MKRAVLFFALSFTAIEAGAACVQHVMADCGSFELAVTVCDGAEDRVQARWKSNGAEIKMMRAHDTYFGWLNSETRLLVTVGLEPNESGREYVYRTRTRTDMQTSKQRRCTTPAPSSAPATNVTAEARPGAVTR